MRDPKRPARPLRHPARRARISFERLEDRTLLDASNIFAQFEGAVPAAGSVQRIPITISKSNFTLPGSQAVIGFEVQAPTGSSLDPAAVTITTSSGATVTPTYVNANLGGTTQSLILASLTYGSYNLAVGGDRGTSGAFQLNVFLAGDADGNHQINLADGSLIRSLIGSVAGDGRYIVAADSNLDGMISSFDYTQWRYNLNDATSVTPLALSLQTPPGLVTLPSGSLATATAAITLNGTTNPGAAVALGTGSDGQFDEGSTTANSSGLFSFSVALTPGANNLQVRATDSFGQQQTAAIGIVLDTQAPSVTITSPAQGLITNSNPTLVGRVLDNLTGVASLQEAVDGGAYTPVSFDTAGNFSLTTSLPLDHSADGSHTVHLVSTDFVGNVSPVTNFAFTLDSTPPAVTVTSPPPGLTTTQNITITGHVADALSGVASAEWALDGGAFAPLSLDAAGNFSLTSSLALDGTDDGPHTVHFLATDRAGNVSAPSDFAFTLDTCMGFGNAVVAQSGGSNTGMGSVTISGCDATLREGDSFDVTLSQPITIPPQASTLSFDYSDLDFDTTSQGRVKDAFEVALVDASGNSLVPTFAASRDAFLNVSEGQPAELGAWATQNGQKVTLDVSNVTPGTVASLVFRLVNNDGDVNTSVDVGDVQVAPLLGQPVDPGGQPAASPAQPGAPIDFAALSDVSASVQPVYGRSSFDQQDSVLYADVAARNAGQYFMDAPLIVAIDHISDPSVRVAGADGTTPDGLPYFDLSALVPGGKLGAGETTDSRTVAFDDPNGIPFTYDLVFLAELNRPPQFTSTPKVQAVAGSAYVYDATAADPDNDPLTFSLLSGPSGMTVGAASGTVTWSPASADVGNAAIALLVDDGHGGSAEQDFTLSVINPPPDRPPVFTSTPIVSASVSAPYIYQATASDPDDDPLTFAVISGPSGMAVDPTTGLVTWTPSSSQTGSSGVELSVTDGKGGTATQSFAVIATAALGDHPPTIISTPVTQLLLQPQSTPYDYAVKALDPDNDPLTYSLVTAPSNFSIDPSSGLVQGTVTASEQSVVNLEPTDDSIVLTEPASRLEENGGDSPFLEVFAGDEPGGNDPLNSAIDFSFLRFNLSGVTWPVTSLQLVIHTTIVSGSSTIGLYHVADNNWAQGTGVFSPFGTINPSPDPMTGITGANFGDAFLADLNKSQDLLAQATPTQAGQDVVFDFSGYDLQPDIASGYLTLALAYESVPQYQSTDQQVRFSSKEGLNPPTLEIGHLAIPITVRVDDGRGGFDTQSYTINAAQGTPGEIQGVITLAGTSTGLAGVTVFLDTNQNGILDPGEVSTVTNAQGDYTFTGLAPGTYPVAEVPPQGWQQASPVAGRTPDTLYGVSQFQQGSSHVLYTIDNFQTAPVAEEIGPVGSIWSLAGDPATGGLYGTTIDSPTTSVYSIDPATGATTLIGTPGIADQNSLAFGPDGYLYSWGYGIFDNLYRVNPVTGAATFVLDTGHWGADLAFDTDGTLYGISYDGSLLRFDLTNLTSTVVGTLTSDQGLLAQGYYAPGLIIDSQGVMYAVASIEGSPLADLYRVDKTTAAATWIGSIAFPNGFGGTGDLALLPGSTTTSFYTVTLAAGQTSTGNNFTDQPLPGSITGTVTRSTDNEPLAGWTVFLDQNHDGKLDPGDPTATTNPQGDYAFTGLAPGNYTVAEVPPQGWQQASPVAAVTPDALYGVSLVQQTGSTVLYAINNFQTSPVAEEVGTVGSIESIAIDPKNGLGYGTTIGSTTSLYSIDLATGSTQFIGFFGASDQNSLTFGPDGFLYSWGFVNGDLWRVNPETAAATLVLNTGHLGADLAFDTDGTLYGASLDGTLLKIDLTDLTTTVIGHLAGNGGSYPTFPSGANLAIDSQGVLYAASGIDGSGVSDLYRVNKTTAAATWIGSIAFPSGFGGNADLALLPGTTTTPYFTDTLAAGQSSTDNDFSVTPTSTPQGPPSPWFTSTPSTQAVAESTYEYNATAVDPTGSPLTFDLPVAPAGMAVDPTTGEVVWTPDDSQTGQADAILRVRDSNGGVALQSFTLTVAAADRPPVITSTPLGPATAGYPYQYQVLAQDADDDPLTYSLATNPVGMTIDPSSGLVTWTPTVAQVGTAPVDVVVTDGQGGGADQSFNLPVVAASANRPPVISSTPRDTIGLGRTYLYAVQATDPDGDPITYSLTTAPAGMTISASGLVTWNPTQAQLGQNAVAISVNDGRGGVATQDVAITVSASVTSQPPSITSSPPLFDVVGRPFSYNATAVDPQSDPLYWFLDTAPAGMSIDQALGTIRWTPVASQVGPQAVTVRVVDAEGGSDSQSFSVAIFAADIPPQIISTPPTDATVGSSYAYAVQTVDTLNNPLTFTLPTKPSGMTIDPVTGLILWTPTSGQAGPQNVSVLVADSLGGSTSQSFTVVASTSTSSLPPVITSTPSDRAIVGTGYSYAVTATDPSGATLTYSLLAPPAGMAIVAASGLVSWTPTTAQLGDQTVTVAAADPSGATASQRFVIDVEPVPAPPLITSSPVTAVTAGLTYHYDVQASDPDNTPLSYQIVAGPSGMAVDSLGRITWATAPSNVGSAHVQVEVDDGLGLSVTQTYAIMVSADTQAPRVQLEMSENPAKLGDMVTFQVLASDNVGVTSEVLTVGGTIRVLDANGTATLKVTQAGSLNVLATASDLAGNTAKATASLVVFDPSVTGAPNVAIASPTDGATVTTFTDVTGTVADQHLASWSLDVYTLDGVQVKHIAGGTTPVNNALLGTFDPTLLANDTYDLRLTATNTGNHTSTVDQEISVAGNLKLGNFTLSFTDLTVPVSGIPITVTRTYDTLNAGTSEDFGYGWQLEFGDTNLQTSVPTTGQESEGIFSAFQNGTRVYVTLPGGQREGFTFTPQLSPGFASGFLGIMNPSFTADPGVTDTLSVTQFDLRQNDDGTYSDFNGDLPYNPASPSFGGTYTLTTKDGIVYTINGQTGMLDTVADRNGDALTFSPSGITSTSGEKVTFERDPEGRITSVIDPSGNTIHYTYDAAGDLVAVTDLAGNVTTFDYSTDFAHYLQDVIDPLGRTGVKTLYDDQGRLIGLVDAAGKTVDMAYDPTDSSETVTDALGNPTTYEYDAQGNILTEIDALGGVTTSTYDANNNLLSQTDPLGRTTTYTYDASGNALTTTDPMGNVTRSTYGAYGDVLTTSDPLGNTTTNAYDAKGNLLSTTDPLGDVTKLTYDISGNPITLTDAIGDTTAFQYDSQGQVISTTDALGHTTTTTYDSSGNPITSTSLLTTPSGVQTLVTKTVYDANGNVISVTDADGHTTSSQFNADGLKISDTDALGNVTKYLYDARGELIETDYPDGTSTKTEYDAAGNVIAQIDQEGRVTTMQYDALGRLVKTINPDGTSTSTVYDADGEVTAQIDELGNKTTFAYDADGRQVSVTDALGDVTSTAYDAAGNAVATTDPLGHTTKSVYDAAGQLIETIYADGTTTSTTYDAVGRGIAETDQLGRTTHDQYDALGHLTAVVDALGQTTSYAYDEAGDLISQTDANGHTTTYEYDGLGQKIATILPMGQKSTTTYDANGNVASTTDFNGATITYQYDVIGRLTAENLPDGTTETFTYTATGQRASDTVPGWGTTTYTYDALDRLLSKTDPDGTSITYTYDAAGDRTSITIPAGTTTYTFDALGRMATVTDPQGGVTTYTYDAAGNLVKTQFPNNTSEIRQYDSLNRLVYLEDDGPSGVIASYKYTLAANGRTDSVVEANGRTDQYNYDALDRLIEEIITDPVNGNQDISYTYDPVGNRLTMVDSTQGTTDYTYDANDRLLTSTTGSQTTKYTYDNNGNTLSQITSATDQVLYEWDSQNQLIDAKVTNSTGTQEEVNRYDADGNLVQSTVDGQTTNKLVDTNLPYAQVVEEYTPGGQISSSAVFGIGTGPISQVVGGARTILLVDGLGSTRALTDSSGKVIGGYVYDAFGNTLAHSGNAVTRYLFEGEYQDQTTGLDDLRARYLDPATGRFLSVDPLHGASLVRIFSNSYAYADGDPVNLVDPSGRQASLAELAVELTIQSTISVAQTAGPELLTLAIAQTLIQYVVIPGFKWRYTGLDLIARGDDEGFQFYNKGNRLIQLGLNLISTSSDLVTIADVGLNLARLTQDLLLSATEVAGHRTISMTFSNSVAVVEIDTLKAQVAVVFRDAQKLKGTFTAVTIPLMKFGVDIGHLADILKDFIALYISNNS